MIGFLKGKVDTLSRPFVLIDVNGVGYKVLVPDSVYSKLTKGEDLKIYTYTYVREDELSLFGFLEMEDLVLFESLLTVSGVGPKTALNIFSFGQRSDIVDAIVRGDYTFFSSVPRLGTKNAQKIVIELKSKMGADSSMDLSGKDFVENAQVVEALKNFGFSQKESQEAIRNIKEQDLSLDEKIKIALKNLGNGKR